jgi:serine/threonine protein kinase/formylglycine-generating enzyme required for sulfatase activity
MPTIGDFQFENEDLLGKGAWGEVYRGNQVSLNRPVAIKILKKELTQDGEFVRRFKREAEVLAKVADEHIVQVFGAGQHEGSYFFAMELVQGVPLQKFIEKGRKFSVDEVVYIGLAVDKALKTAWESPGQIVHRDIKPSNIMVSFTSSLITQAKVSREAESSALLDFDIKESRVKVMDFGLAKACTEAKDATLIGTVIGTPKYISPEQGLGNSADIRSDIYSLGIVLYEMSTGRIPFESETAMSLIRHHIYDTPTSPTQFNQELTPEMESVILKCIQKDPNARYQNPNELLEDLEAIRQARKPLYASQVASSLEATLVPGMATQRKKTGLIKSIVIILLIGAAAAYYFMVYNKPKEPIPSGTAQTPQAKLASLIAKARTAIQIKNLGEANRLIIEASGMVEGKSTELEKLIDEFHAAQPVKDPKEIEKKIKGVLQKARMEIETNNLDEAKRLIGEAYALDPDYPEIKEVRDLLKQQQATKPKPTTDIAQKIENLIEEGNKLMSQNNIEESIRRFTEAHSLAQTQASSKEYLERLEPLLKKANEARNIAQQEEKQKIYKKYFDLGMENLTRKQWQSAIEAFTEAMKNSLTDEVKEKLAIARDEDNKLKNYNSIINRANDLKKADGIEDLKAAINLYDEAGKLLDYKEDHREGIKFCYSKINIAYANIGKAYMEKQLYNKAIEIYETALSFNPEDAHCRNQIANIKKLIEPPDKGMVFVDGGEFLMGESNEKVMISPFFIDKYEVTNEEYKEFLNAIKKTNDHTKCHPKEPKRAGDRPKDHTPKFWKGDNFPQGEEKLPVVGVDWYDVYAYASWRGKRLPTEAEWEKAARGCNDNRKYPWGNETDMDKIKVNVRLKTGASKISPCGAYINDKSPCGCFDMAGNISEWTADQYDKSEEIKSIRGNSFNSKLDPSSKRNYYNFGTRTYDLGFRCVKSMR